MTKFCSMKRKQKCHTATSRDFLCKTLNAPLIPSSFFLSTGWEAHLTDEVQAAILSRTTRQYLTATGQDKKRPVADDGAFNQYFYSHSYPAVDCLLLDFFPMSEKSTSFSLSHCCFNLQNRIITN